MKAILPTLILTLITSTAFGGAIQCSSTTPRHHLSVFLPDNSDIVEINNEGNKIHYKLSAASAQHNRKQLPVLLESAHGDMVLKMNRDTSGSHVLGAVKLRILDERVPLVCEHLGNF